MIVERIDGTDRRVLVPTRGEVETVPNIAVGPFTPDHRSLIVADAFGFHIVSLADGSMITLLKTYHASNAIRLLGTSPFSADGSEMSVQSEGWIAALDLGAGKVRNIAPIPMEDIVTLGFAPDDRVLWLDQRPSSPPPATWTQELHAALPGNDRVLVSESGESWFTVAATPAFVATPGASTLVRYDGTVIARSDPTAHDGVADILGASADGRAAFTISRAGTVRMVTGDGVSTDLAQAALGSWTAVYAP